MELQNINVEGRERRTPLRTSITNRVDNIKFMCCFQKGAWWPKMFLISVFSVGIFVIVAMISSIRCEGSATCYGKCREKYFGQMVCGGRHIKDDAIIWPSFGKCSCDCNCLSINKTLGQLECTPQACILLEGEVEEFPGRI